MRDLAKWGLVGLPVLAVLAGIYALGGPESGRIAMRDAERIDDLQHLRELVECIAASTNGEVPETLDGQGVCTWDAPRNDPSTGALYRYEKLTATAFQLCAGFEDTDRILQRFNLPLDARTGCIIWTYQP